MERNKQTEGPNARAMKKSLESGCEFRLWSIGAGSTRSSARNNRSSPLRGFGLPRGEFARPLSQTVINVVKQVLLVKTTAKFHANTLK
jgi:hypothetical protein